MPPRESDAQVFGAPGAFDVRVDLAGHVLPLAELRARPERYRHRFEAARRSPGFALCLCTRAGQRLVLREVAGRFHLARWPDSADDHVPGCPFFSAQSRHTGASTHRDAITVTEHGTRIAVDVAFTAAVPDPDAHREDDDGDLESDAAPMAGLLPGARPGAATITLLGLLHFLWESAGLTRHTDPSQDPPRASASSRRAADRGWGDCVDALTPLVATLRLGGDIAAARLHVITPYHRPTATADDAASGAAAGARTGGVTDRPGDAARAAARDAELAAFLRPLEHPETVTIRGGPRRGRTRHVRHRRLLLAELKDLTPTAHGHKLALRHFPRPIFLTGEQRTHLTRTYPAAFTDRRGPRARRVLLVLVEGTPSGYLHLVDAAVMTTSSGYVPGESSHELAMIDALTAAGRSFFKPLRYGGAATHPDFVLTDTSPATVVEVWGVTGRADYEARRAVKQEHYGAAGTPTLEWDVRDPIPTIPAPPAPSLITGSRPDPGRDRDRGDAPHSARPLCREEHP